MRASIELLAPAGNEKALRAAVQSGADAVYIGGRKFGARKSAENFTTESIRRQADYCHLYGADIHATVNTLIKDSELSEFADYVRALAEAGVDALIVQDIGAAELIREIVPDMPLHASTQMTVTSLEGVKYLEEMGFSRVVLARELSAEEIGRICAGAKAEIEVFVHGAICMCYSGQCLMSSILGGRSGNRGCCAQPCRLPYTLAENGRPIKSAYALSPKDMALINDLRELKRLGVSSLKIEGRLKRAEYVSAVVGIYRKYLDDTRPVERADMRELRDAFSRSGFTDGYFTGKTGAAMMSHKTPGSTDNSYSDEAKKRASNNANIRKIPIGISGELREGEAVRVTVSDYEGHEASVLGTVKAEAAINNPTDRERFSNQLAKTGATLYEVKEIHAYTDGIAAIPVSEINRARREALERLTGKRIQRETKKIYLKTWGQENYRGQENGNKNAASSVRLSVDATTAEQAEAAAKNGIELIYAPKGIAEAISKKYERVTAVAKNGDIFGAEIEGFPAATVSSNAQLYHYRHTAGDTKLYGTHRLNVFNALAARHYADLELVTLSPELNLREIKALADNTSARLEVIGYGRIALMLMKNCPIKALGKCAEHKNRYALRDRKNEEFPLICLPDCRAALLNSKPIFMADRIDDLTELKISYIKLIFTVENFSRCDKIIKMYKSALEGERPRLKENTFTRGHYYRGVE